MFHIYLQTSHDQLNVLTWFVATLTWSQESNPPLVFRVSFMDEIFDKFHVYLRFFLSVTSQDYSCN
jgi:hypothetical protein